MLPPHAPDAQLTSEWSVVASPEFYCPFCGLLGCLSTSWPACPWNHGVLPAASGSAACLSVTDAQWSLSAMLPAYPRVSLYDTVQMLGPICARMPAFRTETLSTQPGTGLGCPARCPWRFAGLWRECWGVFLRLDGAVWTIDKDGKGTAANDSCA